MTSWSARLHRRRMQNRLSAFHAGELSPGQRVETEKHLTSCEACRRVLEGFALVDRALTVSRPEPSDPGFIRSESLFRAALEESRKPPRSHPGRLAVGLTLAAAGLAAALFVFHKLPAPGPLVEISFTAQPKVRDGLPPGPLPERKGAMPSLATKEGDFFKKPTRLLTGRPLARTARVLHQRARRRAFVTRFPLQRSKMLADLIAPSRNKTAVYSKKKAIADSLQNVTLAERTEESVARTQALPVAASRLVLIVTGQESQRLNVLVTTGDSSEYGFAKVSAFAPNAMGNGVLKQCTIRNDEETESTYTTQYRLVAGKPVSRLTLGTDQPAEKSLSLEKGTKP